MNYSINDKYKEAYVNGVTINERFDGHIDIPDIKSSSGYKVTRLKTSCFKNQTAIKIAMNKLILLKTK